METLPPIVEVPYIKDPHVTRLVARMARMEALVEDRDPYLVGGRVRACKAFGQRLQWPGAGGSIGDLDVLTAAHGRGCEISIVAKRIDRRCAQVVAEEIERFVAGM